MSKAGSRPLTRVGDVRTLLGNAWVPPRSEAVRHASVEDDRVLLLVLDEDVDRAAPELGGEAEVFLYIPRSVLALR